MTQPYRTEIDGLRALAVLPVILFHANLGIASGGFIGVDIFFVISGYLITRIILGELHEGAFSVKRFYERRVRRILPALLTILAITSGVMMMIMLPTEFRQFAGSLLSATFFASNVYFQRTSGYFDPAAEEQPLLHTWSLAVEEQFYIFFPLALMLIWRLHKRGTLFWIALGLVASFGLSLWALDGHSTVNFYYLPTRAWELLLGAFCAQVEFKRQRVASNELLGFAGVVGIVVSVFVYDSHYPWPSFYTILPTISAALVLFYSSGTWAGKMLSVKPLRVVGLLSYSAYLWHYPLFVSANLLYLSENQSLMWALVLLTLVLAGLTYRIIEVPFRRHYRFRANLLYIGGLTSFILLIAALGYLMKPGDRYAVFDAAMNDKAPTQNACHWDETKTFPPQHPISGECYKESNQLMFHIMGDSHAPAIGYVIGQMLQTTPYGYYDYSYQGCIPLKGFLRKNKNITLPCDDYAKDALGQVNAANSALVLTSRWPMWVHAESFNNEEGGVELKADLQMRTPSGDIMSKEMVLAAIKKSLMDLLDRYPVILIYSIPEAGWSVPKYAARKEKTGHYDGSLSTRYDLFLERNKEIFTLFDGIQHPNLYRIKPHEVLCDTYVKGRCANIVDHQIFYFDDDHLSLAGAKLLAPAIANAIEEIKQKKAGWRAGWFQMSEVVTLRIADVFASLGMHKALCSGQRQSACFD